MPGEPQAKSESSNFKESIHPTDNALMSVSLLIALLGTVTNTLSLSYFVTKLRPAGERNNDVPTTKIFLALNLFDLLVCLSTSAVFIAEQLLLDRSTLIYEAFSLIFRIMVHMTGFLTCLLAVIRLIHLVFPRNVTNWIAVKFSIAFFSIVITAVNAAKFFIEFVNENLSGLKFQLFIPIILASLFTMIVLVNVISLIKLCLWKLSQREMWRRKATITVFILSVIYCVCNIGYVVLEIIGAYSLSTCDLVDGILIETLKFHLLPLNSAVNPVVYLIRRADMRSHVKILFTRFAGCICRRKRDTIAIV
jgi:hypothetical protein